MRLRQGKVWGIQYATSHRDLAFDIDELVYRGNRRKRVQETAFLHVGQCVHINVVKAFMREHDVEFQEV